MLSFQEIMIALEIGIIYGILVLGIYLTFRTINFPDLTCDGSFITGAAISAILIKNGWNPYFGLVGAIIAGGTAGLATGILNIKFKIDDLLSGIIVAFMLYSINLRILGTNPNISLVGETTIFSYGNSLIISGSIVLVILLILTYCLSSDWGLGLRAVGQNKQFSAANGVNVNLMIIFGLIISNALVGLSGAVFTQYQGFCDVSQGVGCLVIGLAAVIIGEELIFQKQFVKIRKLRIGLLNFLKIFEMLIFCIFGSVTYRIFIAIAINSDILGLKTQDLNLITGLLMIAIMRRNKKC